MLAIHSLAALAIFWAGAICAAPTADVSTTVVVPHTTLGTGNVAHAAHPTIKSHSAQSDGSIFVCTDSNFRGECANFPFTAGKCLDFQFDFQDTISSAGPDNGFICTLYIDIDCNGGSFSIVNPGVTNKPEGFNDKITSFRYSFV